MTHTQLIEKFKGQLDKHFDEYFFYVIPNPQGASLRPFDSFLLYEGRFYAFEFKTKKDKLKKHQRYYLDKVVKNRGVAKVVTEKTDLDMLFFNIKFGVNNNERR